MKKRRRQSHPPREPNLPSKKKMIKESDLYYSQIVAPIQRELRRAQQFRNLDVIDELWNKREQALRQYQLLVKRACYIKRP
ncbi:MAG: hypothetical protein M0Z65_11015 [Firmicutes bacterium]|uniref:hypothetical protein n=1 Tax=Melghirimyces thermohalophilus TaxID=1236220 RepID=UPI00115F7D0E|nr:hypothetical protein [Melghirimyces thermohalophilus]MDA8353686.1 hypothetical protein [Bacillota bacterium]